MGGPSAGELEVADLSCEHRPMVSPSEIYGQLEMFDRFTAVEPQAALALHDFVKERGIKRTMEVGLAFGSSAAHTIAATLSRHVAIDHNQATQWKNLGIKNLQKLGFGQYLELLEMRSHSALPQLARDGRAFNFIFIDGNHRFDDVFVDFILCDGIIEMNGYVVLDDMWMPSIQRVASFIRTNRADYTEISPPHPRFAVFQKCANDERDWKHFVEF
jgi:predicted O-methyltransferase YrrM